MDKIITLIGILNWPQVALIFGIIFILVFRPQIALFLSKLKSVGKDGFKAEENSGSQPDKDNRKIVEQLMSVSNSMLLLEQEALIKKDLNQKGLDTKGDTNSILIRHLAATQIALDFEQIHNTIFGSQIYLLKNLHQNAGLGISPELTKKHFEHVLTLFSEFKTWSMEQYLDFLLRNNLIIIQNGNYHITVKGGEFLVWIAQTARSENKPL